MTMTLSREALDGYLGDTTAESLGDNSTAHAVWDAMRPLLDGSEISQQFGGQVPKTPLLEVPKSALPPDLQDTQHRVFLLADGDMPSGGYKFRGVMSALLRTVAEDPELTTVYAASTGNHAAAVSLAATLLGLESVVFMPEDAVTTKVANTTRFGGRVEFAPSLEDTVALAEQHGQEPGTAFIHPFDHLHVVAGQGTATVHLAEQLATYGLDPSEVDLYFPVGGGGNATGNVVSGKVLLPDARKHIVQAEDADVLIAEAEGRQFDLDTFDSAVDGAAVKEVGKLARDVLLSDDFVDGRHTARRGQIGEAMAVTARFTDLYEPAGALALAGALAAARRDPTGRRVFIAHATGINTTPEKVHEFAAEAYRSGYLSGAEASALISRSHLDGRRPFNDVETRAMELVAQRAGVAAVRSGCRVVSGHW